MKALHSVHLSHLPTLHTPDETSCPSFCIHSLSDEVLAENNCMFPDTEKG